MRWFPWSADTGGEPEADPTDPSVNPPDADPIVACPFQDGSVFVYEDRVYIDRPSNSQFDGKWITLSQVRDVVLEKKLTIHYLQIQQQHFEHGQAGLLSPPVGENTVHFGGGKRGCADRARVAILDHADVTDQSE